MNSQTVEITSTGIRRILNRFTPEKAIAEFVWNGFDAKATVIKIDFVVDNEELDTFKEIRILDNGIGINYEELSEKFKKFHESSKLILNDSNVDLTRGKNGYGRFTFFKFAQFAKWQTCYKKDSSIMAYDIDINNDNLKDYVPTSPISNTKKDTGTCVIFNEIDGVVSKSFIEKKLIPYLKAEFAWYLELKEEYKIYINDIELDYSSIITDNDDFVINIKGCEQQFKCKYIQWNQKMNDEFSKFYFLNSKLDLQNIQTTRLNNKGDEFWHSIVVINDFFDLINSDNEKDNTNNPQLKLFDSSEDRKTFKELITKLNEYLKEKRRPFLKQQASALIDKYEGEKVFPEFGNEEWDKLRKQSLKDLVKNLYEVEPAVFIRLNTEQKKIFLELLNLVMDSYERDNLFKIIGAVINLDSTDREEFAKILETTRLQQVISTINLILDRIKTLENLKKLVFKHELKANEKDHLQTFIEKHYWIFGEEYRFVCAEEVKFEKALRKYIYILRGVNEKTYIEHIDKHKEMDLFLTGTDFRNGNPHNLVIEIKNPTTIKKLSNKEYSQLETYMDVILKQDCFNNANESWTFMLIGLDYDDIVARKITNKLTGLTVQDANFSVFVRKWSEITLEIENRLKYLLEKLKTERNKLSKSNTLVEVMNEVANNSAVVESD